MLSSASFGHLGYTVTTIAEYVLRTPITVPYTYLKTSMTNFGQICRITASLAQDWKDTSAFDVRGTIC
jgi:hypothetical protein